MVLRVLTGIATFYDLVCCAKMRARQDYELRVRAQG
jgi:hypothetical protein